MTDVAPIPTSADIDSEIPDDDLLVAVETATELGTRSYGNVKSDIRAGLAASSDIPSPATATPQADGTGAAGTSTDYARGDHVHPSSGGGGGQRTRGEVIDLLVGDTGGDIDFTKVTPVLESELRGTIRAGVVGAGNLAGDAVTTGKIANNAVTGDKIANAAVNTTELHSGAVTADKIAGGAVTDGKIARATITGDRIAANTIGVAKLPSGASAGKYLDGDGTWKTIPSGGGLPTGAPVNWGEVGFFAPTIGGVTSTISMDDVPDYVGMFITYTDPSISSLQEQTQRIFSLVPKVEIEDTGGASIQLQGAGAANILFTVAVNRLRGQLRNNSRNFTDVRVTIVSGGVTATRGPAGPQGSLSGGGVNAIVALTQAEYNALDPKVSTTLYIITG